MSKTDHGIVVSIDGPVIGIKGLKYQKIGDLVKIGHNNLIGEIIKIVDKRSIATCYEYTEGLRIGKPVINTKEPLSMELGPGLLNNIYDGIQRTSPVLREKYGDFIEINKKAAALDRKKQWQFEPRVKEGTKVSEGDIIGVVQESNTIEHRIMVPIGVHGKLTYIARPSKFTVQDDVYAVKNGKKEQKFGLSQKWSIRSIRPYFQRIFPTKPLITGMRVIDILFPVAKGGVVAVPGGFGTGKTVIQHNLAKWADANIIVYVGCGERGNEMADVLEQFPNLIDPHTNRPLMEKTVLIGNTSNMPVSAQEASIFSGLTIAEYYRDMGYDVALLADSTTRWAEALRELSGRLEEMPAEGGYPAYLSTRLASFYERAGLITPLGSPKRVGSITLVGAVSPPSGDFSEPVTKTTRRFVKAFWALDAKLAYSRHYPSVSWTDSYSLYSEHLEEWWNKLGNGWARGRTEISEILARSDELQNIVQLVGKENLPAEQQLTLFVADLVKNVYLIQNAFDPVDRYSSPEKSLRLVNLILDFFDQSKDIVNRGIPLFEVENLPIVTKISRARLSIKNEDIKQFDILDMELKTQCTSLIERYESASEGKEMKITYSNIQKIEGPLVFLQYQHNVMNGEVVQLTDPDGIIRNGRVLEITDEVVCIEVFQGTSGLDTDKTQITFSDELFEIEISRDMLGRIFDGQGKPKKLSYEDTYPELLPEVVRPISGAPINPYSRSYPTDVISTGISVIDGLTTLVRGQKLPIFTGQGLSHNKLATQIVKQAKVHQKIL